MGVLDPVELIHSYTQLNQSSRSTIDSLLTNGRSWASRLNVSRYQDFDLD